MSIWKEIKYALNSTLGTADFKPLDKLLKAVDGIVASDKLYLIVQDTSVTISEFITLSEKIKLNADGSIKIRFKFSNSASYSSKSFDLYTYINEIQHSEDEIEIDSQSSYVFNKTITVKKGDIISFGFKNHDKYSHIDYVHIYAEPVNLSGITIY